MAGLAAGGGTPSPTGAGRSTGSSDEREGRATRRRGARRAPPRDAHGRQQRAVDHILSWSCVALGPADANPHAGRGSRVGAGVVPPAPALPDSRVHRLVPGEGAEHVEQGLDYREGPAVALRVLVGRYGHNGVRRVAKRHRVPDAGPERPKTIRDPAAGVGSVVPGCVDGDEVRTDDGNHTSTVSRRPWLAPFASGWLTVTPRSMIGPTHHGRERDVGHPSHRGGRCQP
jgi:hypothetical protein